MEKKITQGGLIQNCQIDKELLRLISQQINLSARFKWQWPTESVETSRY